jgi:hypothetical protein
MQAYHLSLQFKPSAMVSDQNQVSISPDCAVTEICCAKSTNFMLDWQNIVAAPQHRCGVPRPLMPGSAFILQDRDRS